MILSLEEDLADICNGSLGSSGGETDGGLLILHTVKNYTVAPDQFQHEGKTNQHGTTSGGEIRTKGKSKPVKISPLWHNWEERRRVKDEFNEAGDAFAPTQDETQP